MFSPEYNPGKKVDIFWTALLSANDITGFARQVYLLDLYQRTFEVIPNDANSQNQPFECVKKHQLDDPDVDHPLEKLMYWVMKLKLPEMTNMSLDAIIKMPSKDFQLLLKSGKKIDAIEDKKRKEVEDRLKNPKK